MESIEATRKRDFLMQILTNDSLLIAWSLSKNQSITKTKATLMKKILYPKVSRLSEKE